MKKVAMVILSWNTLNYLKQCVESIKQWTPADLYDFFIVDRGSTDGSIEYIKSLNVRYELLTEEKGYATGMNLGIKTTDNEYVNLVNSDTFVSHKLWLESMIVAYESRKNQLGIVSPLIRNANTGEFPRKATGGTKFTPGVMWLLRRSVINEIGLLYEGFGYGLMEDVDYCDRTKDAGYAIYVCPDSIVDHWEHRTFIANNLDMASINRDNRVKYAELRKLRIIELEIKKRESIDK